MASQTPSGARRSRLVDAARRGAGCAARAVRKPPKRWSSKTESGLQACYGKSPGNGAFLWTADSRAVVRLTPRRADCGLVDRSGAVARRAPLFCWLRVARNTDANTVSFGVATCDRSRFTRPEPRIARFVAAGWASRGCTKQPLDATWVSVHPVGSSASSYSGRPSCRHHALHVGRPEVDPTPHAGIDDLLQRLREAVEAPHGTRRRRALVAESRVVRSCPCRRRPSARARSPR